MENGNNHINIAGRICSDFAFSHEVYGEGFYRFDVEVERLSEAMDILPVTVSERIIDRARMTVGGRGSLTSPTPKYSNSAPGFFAKNAPVRFCISLNR